MVSPTGMGDDCGIRTKQQCQSGQRGRVEGYAHQSRQRRYTHQPGQKGVHSPARLDGVMLTSQGGGVCSHTAPLQLSVQTSGSY